MVGIGVLMVLVGWWSVWKLFRGPRESRDGNVWLLRALSVMTFSGWVAVLAGWYVTEIGRQPWVVSGLLRTADVVADHSSATVAGTLFGYVLLYLFLLVSYIAALRYMATKPARSLSLSPQQRAMEAELDDDEHAEGER